MAKTWKPRGGPENSAEIAIIPPLPPPQTQPKHRTPLGAMRRDCFVLRCPKLFDHSNWLVGDQHLERNSH